MLANITGTFAKASLFYNGLIAYCCRLIIPTKLRPVILSQLHESHQGSVTTKKNMLVSLCTGLE